MGGGASTFRRAGKRIGFSCVSFSAESSRLHQSKKTNSISTPTMATFQKPEETMQGDLASNKSLCAICLEPLNSIVDDEEEEQATIFTAPCAHSFHHPCIASNVRHGSVTCPICRSYWSHLPRQLTASRQPPCQQADPIIRILDDFIATSRLSHRSSILHPVRYDDDDPVEPTPSLNPRMRLAVVQTTSPSGSKRLSLSVSLSHQDPTDVVLVVSLNITPMRLLRQSMAFVVFSLRSVDRLAIVTCSADAANRPFPLRRMSSEGKRAALHAIDRLYFIRGEADPTEGLVKGVKILGDRTHHNPMSFVLHISDARGQDLLGPQFPVPIHRFSSLGNGFGDSNALDMHEFENFFVRVLGVVIGEVEVRVGEGGEWVRLGEMAIGEERRVPMDLLGGCKSVRIGYSYVEGVGGDGARKRSGEVAVGVGEKGEGIEARCWRGPNIGGGRRSSSLGGWDHVDTLMARRWSKHLHGFKF